jgi:tetratricopeptide (TPR) repeat protein
MQKILLTIITGILLPAISFSQDEKDKKVLTGDEAKAVLNQVFPDSTSFLRNAAHRACDCIDSVDLVEKNKQKKIEGFSGCIDREVESYQLATKLLNSMKSPGNKEINLYVDKNSSDYKHYYYDIERWVKDSCQSLNKAMGSNNEAKEKSFSKNPDAMNAYNAGVPLLDKENYSAAIPFFEKAVSIDPEFVFAWDNLGVCYRHTEKYDKAEVAYKTSLKIDPTNKTALQNLPLVYQLQKRNDDAIAAYNNFLSYYPDDPEVFYGVGLLYFNKDDMENALKNLCKAYNIYVEQKSAYRSDAEKVINMIYANMKKAGKENVFNRILKENHIKSN